MYMLWFCVCVWHNCDLFHFFINYTKHTVSNLVANHSRAVDILQGSVETRLRCGGICNGHLIVMWVCWWKNFENSSIFWCIYDKNFVFFTFWTTRYMCKSCLKVIFLNNKSYDYVMYATAVYKSKWTAAGCNFIIVLYRDEAMSARCTSLVSGQILRTCVINCSCAALSITSNDP